MWLRWLVRRSGYFSSMLMCALTSACVFAQSQTANLEITISCTDTRSQCYDETLVSGLNLAAIPWHNRSGPWGPQVPIELPRLPVTTKTVNVSSPQEFNRAASRPGTEIIIKRGWSGNSVVGAHVNDIDIVIPPSVSIGAIQIGLWGQKTKASRIRIRGPVAGTHSGGRMGQFRDFGVGTDITIDGVDLNGDATAYGGAETNQAFRVNNTTRIAVSNARVIAGGYTWLGSAKHVIIYNSNFYHGGATRAETGYPEGWGIRNTGGPVTIVGSRIQGTRYHNIRTQSKGGAGELLYVADSVLVGVNEGRTAWLWNNLGNGPWSGQGAIIENSEIYSYSTIGCGLGNEISATDVAYSRVTNNEFFGGGVAVFTQSYLNQQAANGGQPGSHDWSVGNTFSPLVSLPPWAGPGDPRNVPLPLGMVLNTGEAPCLFPPI